jgi:hypothetical protein
VDEPTDLSPRVRSLLASAAYEVKTLVAARPAIALRAERRRRPGHVVDDATEIVIESYPRCRLAQEPRAVAIAHHTHMPAQVLEGARRGLPTLVLIREPVPVVVSHLVYRPRLTPISALRGFVRFYGPLEPVLDDVVVATFDQVVSDYGSVIERINDRVEALHGTEPWRRAETLYRRFAAAAGD